MNRGTLVAIVIVLAQGIWGVSARAQAAAEYGMAASKSATITTRARPILDSRGKQIAGRVQAQTSKSLAIVMQENKQKLEEKSRETGGTVHIESVPDKATVTIDGQVVAYTPTDLNVPQGTHLVEVVRAGFLSWRRNVAVTQGGHISLKAELENRYKSAVTLSISK